MYRYNVHKWITAHTTPAEKGFVKAQSSVYDACAAE